MSRNRYDDHDYSPDADENEYRSWAQDGGAYVDVAGNVIWPDQPGHPDYSRAAEVRDAD